MLQNDDSYYELFLLSNLAGFVFASLFFRVFGVSHLKIFEVRSIQSNVTNPAKLFTTTRFRSVDRDYKIVPFNLIKPNLALSISALLVQLPRKIVDVLSSKKLNVNIHKSE